jgi:hypothetical protein
MYTSSLLPHPQNSEIISPLLFPRISHLPCIHISFPSLILPPDILALTSVMYPAVPNIAGTSMTYANDNHAVRRVQRKYLWRLVVMSVRGSALRYPVPSHLLHAVRLGRRRYYGAREEVCGARTYCSIL